MCIRDRWMSEGELVDILYVTAPKLNSCLLYTSLLRAFDKENAAFAKRVGKDRAKNTYNKYLVVRKYVAEFIKYQ